MNKKIKSCDSCNKLDNCLLTLKNSENVCALWEESELSKCQRKLEIATRALENISHGGINHQMWADKTLSEMREI